MLANSSSANRLMMFQRNLVKLLSTGMVEVVPGTIEEVQEKSFDWKETLEGNFAVDDITRVDEFELLKFVQSEVPGYV